MTPNRQKAHPRARRASTVAIEPERVARQGPQGRAQPSASTATSTVDAGRRRRCVVTRPTDRGEHRALHGLTRTLVANMVEGVTDGFEKRLEIQGVGYRAAAQGQEPRAGARLLAPGVDRGARRDRVRGPAADRASSSGASPSSWSARSPRDIRKQRPPEPYKGKGIRYEGEYVARKVGQARMTVLTKPQRAPQAPPPRPREGRAAPPSARASRCSAPTAASPPSSIDDDRRPHAGRRHLDRARAAQARRRIEQAKRAGELLAERAKAAGVETCRVRPRRLPVPRPRQGARRGRPRGRA